MPAPSFLCVGMPKCGTSTLYEVLRHQSEIFVPPVKEIKFLASSKIRYRGSPYQLLFSRHWAARQDRLALMRVLKKVALNRGRPEDLVWSFRFGFSRRDLRWYYSLFSDDHISGDISPIYHILRREDIAGIASAMPDLKIIILLRSPVQQIWSHCRMVIVGLEKQDGSDAFRRHIERLSHGRRTYLSLVEDWSSHFAGQIFVGYLEDMAADPARFFSEVFRFLGAEEAERAIARDSSGLGTRSYAGIRYDVPEDVRATLADHAAMRMEGFDAIAPERTARWQAELEAFRHGEPMPGDLTDRGRPLESAVTGATPDA
jgi:Sulfotransferase family